VSIIFYDRMHNFTNTLKLCFVNLHCKLVQTSWVFAEKVTYFNRAVSSTTGVGLASLSWALFIILTYCSNYYKVAKLGSCSEISLNLTGDS